MEHLTFLYIDDVIFHYEKSLKPATQLGQIMLLGISVNLWVFHVGTFGRT